MHYPVIQNQTAVMSTFHICWLSGWEVASDHIRSGAGSTDNDYLILTLHVPGFK